MTSLKLLLLRLLPKNLFSRFIGCLASSRISKIAIKWFARRYKINLEEAEKAINDYPTLNAFFTRHLKEGCRPIAEADNPQAVISPVDGKIAQWGRIDGNRLIQAKDIDYSLNELLGDETEAKMFENGWFMTIYLSPTDYHRMHHYMDADVTSYRYIPGTLFPVNPFSVSNVKNLFPVNERLTTYYETPYGKAAIVKVGATIVGKIKVTYCDTESNVKKIMQTAAFTDKIKVKKGDELGHFAMGSTVVLLFPSKNFNFIDPVPVHEKVKMGQILGYWQ